MLVAIRDCVKASNVLSLGRSKEYQPLSLKDAFFLATLGGSQGKTAVLLIFLFRLQFVCLFYVMVAG